MASITDPVIIAAAERNAQHEHAALESAAKLIAEHIPDLMGTKGEEIVKRALAEGNQPGTITLVTRRFPGGESLPSIPLLQYNREMIAAKFGPGGYQFTVRAQRGFKGTFQETIDAAFTGTPAPQPQPTTWNQPVQLPPPMTSRTDELFQLLQHMNRRLDAMEQRAMQPTPSVVQQRSVSMVDTIKEIATVMTTLQGLQPKSDGLAAEMERYERIAKFIDVKASGRSLGEVAAEEEDGAIAGIVGKLVEFAGPKLPRLMDAVANRMEGKTPTPAPTRATVQQPARLPAQTVQQPPTARRVTQAPEPELQGMTVDEFFRGPISQAETPPPPTTDDGNAAAEAMILEIAPEYPAKTAIDVLKQGIESGGVPLLCEMLGAHIVNRPEIFGKYEPGHISSTLAQHEKLREHAETLADAEIELRQLMKEPGPDEPAAEGDEGDDDE